VALRLYGGPMGI